MDTQGFLILVVIALLAPRCSKCQIPYQAYLLREKLETALLNTSENKYELNQVFPLGAEPVLIQCVPVKYSLTCQAQHSSSEGPGHIDCVKGYNVSFLWSSFDTEPFLGKLLLHWAMDRVHVMGFNWAEECKLDFKTAITFHLDVSEFCPSTPVSEVDQALVSLTEMLPTLNSKPYPTLVAKTLKSKGFVSKWKDIGSFSMGEVFFSGAAVVVSIASLPIALSVGPSLYKKIYTAINDKKSQIYLYFWACEIVAAFCCWILGPVIHLLVTPFYGLEMLMTFSVMMLMLPVAAWVVIDRLQRHHIDHLIPIPFMLKHGQDCSLQWQNLSKSFRATYFVVNVIAVWNLFAFLLYSLRIVPLVMLSYYVFPHRTLVRVSFYEFAMVIILFAVASLLYYSEKLWWLVMIKSQGPTGRKDSDAPVAESPGITTMLSGHEDTSHLKPPDSSDHIRKSKHQKIVRATIRVFAGIVFLGGSIIVCGIIGVVVFEASRDGRSSPDVSKFLTVVPTLVLNAALWILKKDHILVPDELKALAMASIEKIRPGTPGPTKPVTPGNMKPVTPGITKPVTPGNTKPVTPGITKPVTPEITKPVTPETTKPVTPGITKPVTPEKEDKDKKEEEGEKERVGDGEEVVTPTESGVH